MENLSAIIVVAGALLLPGFWFIANYNRFARLRQHIRESWSGIDVEMKRRYELIPNLVDTVRGYARHERDTLEQVIHLRAQAMQSHGPASEQASDESALMLGIKRVLALVENYPQLKSDAHFRALQHELALTEDRLAAARRFYNANVREMNQLCRSFPTNLIAMTFRFKAASFFELDREAERAVPRVEPGTL